jgi:copper chaperone NosL
MMNNNKIADSSRIAILIAGFSLVAVLFTPIWRIELTAPQYPEGLTLLIHAHKLSGSVDIINGLNHYIGMKTLHADDFVEFKVLPGIILFFAGLFILGYPGRKKTNVYPAWLVCNIWSARHG